MLTAKTIEFLEGNIWVNLHDTGFGNGFLDRPPKNRNKRGNR